jgi:hypothetical protein
LASEAGRTIKKHHLSGLATAAVGQWVEVIDDTGQPCRGRVEEIRKPKWCETKRGWQGTGMLVDVVTISEKAGERPRIRWMPRVRHNSMGEPRSWRHFNHSSNPGAIDAQEETNRKRESASSLDRV